MHMDNKYMRICINVGDIYIRYSWVYMADGIFYGINVRETASYPPYHNQ